MASKSEAWTPYGLEHIRIRRQRRRRALGFFLTLACLILFSVLLSTTTSVTKDTQIFANGNQVSGNGIVIQPPDQAPQKDHVTVGLSPGRATRAEAGSETAARDIQRASLTPVTRGTPYNWASYVLLYGPFVLAGLGLLYFAKRKGKNDEINYGVYKGSMPLEMITASHQGEVFTKRWAKSSIFGKGRADHLPRDLAAVEPAIIEEDG